MRLAIVIPRNDFQVLRAKSEDLVPAVEPQKIRWEHPVLAIRNLGAEVSTEPRRYGCNVWFPSKGGDIRRISCFNSNVCSRSWCLIVAVVWPALL
jgi:hypothetical protein